MKKLILSLSAAFVLTTTLFAQKPDDVAKFNDETIDFGKVKVDNPPTATFIVKNIGKEPLIIEQANPTCGCTIGDYTKAPIAPGKEGWIKATYNAKNVGAFDKHLTVKFAGVSETKTITIKGEVLTAEDYAKMAPAEKVEIKTKVEPNKTKTVIKTDGKKTSKTKVKSSHAKVDAATTKTLN
jgi:hypothetical protein